MAKKKVTCTQSDAIKIIVMAYVDALDNIFFERPDAWHKETQRLDMLWVLEDNRDHPLAYLNVCDVMQIRDPKKLRKFIYFYHHKKDEYDFTEFRIMLERVLKRIRKDLNFWAEE